MEEPLRLLLAVVAAVLRESAQVRGSLPALFVLRCCGVESGGGGRVRPSERSVSAFCVAKKHLVLRVRRSR